jgi:hypothetical protein
VPGFRISPGFLIMTSPALERGECSATTRGGGIDFRNAVAAKEGCWPRDITLRPERALHRTRPGRRAHSLNSSQRGAVRRRGRVGASASRIKEPGAGRVRIPRSAQRRFELCVCWRRVGARCYRDQGAAHGSRRDHAFCAPALRSRMSIAGADLLGANAVWVTAPHTASGTGTSGTGPSASAAPGGTARSTSVHAGPLVGFGIRRRPAAFSARGRRSDHCAGT